MLRNFYIFYFHIYLYGPKPFNFISFLFISISIDCLLPKTIQLNSQGIFENTLNLLSKIFEVLNIGNIVSSSFFCIGVHNTVKFVAKFLTYFGRCISIYTSFISPSPL